jgi:competence protein ComEC
VVYKETFSKRWKEIVLAILMAFNLAVWMLVWQRSPNEILKVYFFDVGQGDAILIESPTHGRVLVDGGRNRQIVTELGKTLSFGDRRIDAVIATHPDADHIGGLPEVLGRYQVGLIISPGVESDNEIDDELRKRAEEKKIQTLTARRGQVLNFGDGVILTILFPDRDVSDWETNDASIVAKLVYGQSSFLLTGDAPIGTENILMNLDKKILDVDVLKAGHHGSRTSTGLTFAEAVSPDYAVVSAGRDNTYGHPHQEVLDILERVGAKTDNTAEKGTIKFETDGEKLEIK